MRIHACATAGDIEGVARQLDEGVAVDSRDTYDRYTPLMCAVISTHAGREMLRFLIEKGADVNAGAGDLHENVLSLAAAHGDIEKIKLLLDAGADIHYQRPSGYDVLIDAMHGRNIVADRDLVDTVELLIARGARADGYSDYGESALRVASHAGRFDVIPLLLAAGADPQQLEWTPLMYAVALGSEQDVAACLAAGADLAARDCWSRTAWLLSLQTGDLGKARLLLAAGATRQDRDHCDRPALTFAVGNGHAHVLAWLLEEGFDPDDADKFGGTPLMEAAEQGEVECVRLLLEAGASLAATDHIEESAIKKASTVEVVRVLVQAGEDLSAIDDAVRAALTGHEYDGELETSREAYFHGKHRRFGTANPEVMNVEFWRAMVRSGATAWRASKVFEDTHSFDGPIWCFHRFGKSITELPDGRFIEIAGEHEDYYDPDFCIYNDVIVHYGGGRFDILGYPKELFPPTDFHSATLVGDFIYIIGSLGYPGEREHGETPVYRLHCQTYAIEKVATNGEKPGWINSHRAMCQDGLHIVVTGGKLNTMVDGKEDYIDNPASYVLDLANMHWHRIEAGRSSSA